MPASWKRSVRGRSAKGGATTKINRQDYGVKFNAKMDNGGLVVGDEVSIIIDAEMVKSAAAK